MICGWSRRRGSEHPLAVILLAVLLIQTAAATGPRSAGAAPERGASGLRWAAERPPTPREERFLDEDRTWLAGLGAGAPTASIVPDSTAVLRALLSAAQSGPEAAAGRSRASLLRDRWIERGYLAARVDADPPRPAPADTGRTRKGRRRAPVLALDPGPGYRIAALDVGGDDFAGRDRLLAIWLPRPGDDFDPPSLGRAVERILAAVGEAGYPFPRWVLRDVATDEAAAEVILEAQLLTGRAATIGPITSDLPPGPGRGFLVRASGLRPGTRFRDSELHRATERLLARDLYLTVDEPRVYLTSAVDTVGIHFPVTPRRRANRLEVVLGLSRRQEEPGSRISGQVDLELPNMAQTGRRLAVGWRDDGADKSRFGFSYLEPLAFGTPLDGAIALDHEVQKDQFTRFRVDNTWNLPVVALWGVNLGLGWDRSTFPAGDLEGTRRLRVLGGLEHRRGDRTRSGWAARLGLETAWRSTTTRSEADSLVGVTRLGEGATQRILTGDLSAERWLGPVWSLAGRVSLRQLRGEEDTAPLSEHFRFGGANTLRGYREDEFHGTTAAWSAMELRVGRAQGSRLYTFYDLGYFEFSALDPLPGNADHRSLRSDWPWGFGLGLLARSARGDLSLAIGFPGTVDFQVAKLHVSLMESF